jgi:hypothetical protein
MEVEVDECGISTVRKSSNDGGRQHSDTETGHACCGDRWSPGDAAAYHEELCCAARREDIGVSIDGLGRGRTRVVLMGIAAAGYTS